MKARNFLGIGGLVAIVALAGCQSGYDGGGPRVARQTGVEGQWIGADGVAVSTLRSGQFDSRSLETGETLTQGSYTHRDSRTIDLDFYSLKSQRNTSATCLLVNSSQMNCTLASGTNFVLTRSAGVS